MSTLVAPTIITHHPLPSCHRTLRRPFNRRGVWNFEVPRPAKLVREQHREAIAREAQRIMVHARWAARRVWQHAVFEEHRAPMLGEGMTITHKRPQADVEWLLNSPWLAQETRKLGVHEAALGYVEKVVRKMAGVA